MLERLWRERNSLALSMEMSIDTTFIENSMSSLKKEREKERELLYNSSGSHSWAYTERKP